jgi:hypothetical protein
MNSATHSNAHASVKNHATDKSTTLTRLFEEAEDSRFGIIAILFVLIPCLAGIAASTALFNNNMTLFVLAGAPAMIVETLILGLASMRSVLIASAVSVVISFIIMFI